MAWILLFLCCCAAITALSQPLTLSSSTVPSTSPILQSRSPTVYKRTKYPTKYPTKPPTSSSPSSSPIVIIVSDQVQPTFQPTITPHSQAPSSEPTKLPSSEPTKLPSSESPTITLSPTQHTESPTWQTEGVAEESDNNPSTPVVGTDAVPATFAFFALLAVPVVGAAVIVHRRRMDNRQHVLVDSLQRVWGSSREFLVLV